MSDILEEIVAHKRVEIEQQKELLAPTLLYQQVEQLLIEQPSVSPTTSMRQTLLSSSTGIIAEFKRKSPSKGWIKEGGKASEIPLSYQQNGASAVSILTDEMFFGGKDAFIEEARSSGVSIPILYKNFIVDEYQLFQARRCGASTVLLIASVLSLKECRSLMSIAHEIGLEVLMEMHAEQELDYVALEPDMCGINNRHLGTFVTDVQNSFRLAAKLPDGICKVSESGISNPLTIRDLRAAGFRGFLIGEMLMKEDHPGDALAMLIQQVENNPIII